MKNLFLGLFAVILFTACEDSTENPVVRTDATNLQVSLRKDNVVAQNRINPYDYAGQLFGEIFDTYHDSKTLPNSADEIVQRVESIANENIMFLAFKPLSYEQAKPARVEFFDTNKITAANSVIGGSKLSANAKQSLTTFLEDYTIWCIHEQNYSTVHENICAYEFGVIQDEMLTASDKEIILVTTSIARYSALAKKRRPKKNTDPAWDLLICTVIGSAENAERSPSEAVTLALAAGIYENR